MRAGIGYTCFHARIFNACGIYLTRLCNACGTYSFTFMNSNFPISFFAVPSGLEPKQIGFPAFRIRFFYH